MLWLLLLHISAVLCWCASLLYLPALIISTATEQTTSDQKGFVAVVVTIFRLIMTPAALIAIVSGTAMFLLGGIADHWLVLKLTLVSTLVLGHALSGWIVLQMQQQSRINITLPCTLLGAGVVILILAIIWVVLTKPF